MKRRCCGAVRHSAFCPNCGKELKSHPLDGITEHVARHVGILAKRVSWLQECLKNPDHRHRETVEKRLAKEKVLLEKWQTWKAALEETIGASQ